MAPDCKSGRESVRWFESIPAHQKKTYESMSFLFVCLFCIIEKSHYDAMALFISLYRGTVCFDSTTSTTFVAFDAVIHNSFGNLISAQSCKCCEAVKCMIFRFFQLSYIAVPCVLSAFSAITYIVFCHNVSS